MQRMRGQSRLELRNYQPPVLSSIESPSLVSTVSLTAVNSLHVTAVPTLVPTTRQRRWRSTGDWHPGLVFSLLRRNLYFTFRAQRRQFRTQRRGASEALLGHLAGVEGALERGRQRLAWYSRMAKPRLPFLREPGGVKCASVCRVGGTELRT